MAVSNDGSFLVTISRDQSVKVFDVAAFDMVLMLRLPFVPKAAEWIFRVRSHASRAQQSFSCSAACRCGGCFGTRNAAVALMSCGTPVVPHS